ncbi:MAG: serine hydrolase [Pseudomonadota bacterium]
MKTLLLRSGLVVAILLAALAIASRERIAQLLAVNSLFDPDTIVENTVSMPELFHSTELSRGTGPVSPLTVGPPLDLPPGYADWVRDRSVTAIVVLKDGQLVHEGYHLGTDASDRRISWSVAKSYLSTLIGTAVDAGEIASIDEPVTAYVPSLSGTAYNGARIRHVLNMSSGVVFNEDYFDFWSDINRMGRVLALGRSMDRFAEGLGETFAPPGQQFRYVSIDTHVLGMVLRGATGQSVPELLEARIIEPLGLEQDGAYITDGYGVAFVLGGLNFTTRDYARFGQMVQNGGTWQGRRIVSAAWLREATRASAATAPGDLHYGYQWWMPADEDVSRADHAFMGLGVYGQHLYIDPEAGVVIATNGADRGFQEDGVLERNVEMFRALTAAATGP